VRTRHERRAFYEVPRSIYQGDRCQRATEESLTRLLVDGPTLFHSHATVVPCLLIQNGDAAGRCALIHDKNLPDYVQVAFFEAQPGLRDVVQELRIAARQMQTGARRLLIGMNGHLNYGAGILLNRFDEPPVFGFPYNPAYYPDYLSGLFCREAVSFRFPLRGLYDWINSMNGQLNTHGITARFLDKRNLRKEMELYTHIDNNAFSNTEYWYWSNRDPRENFELFHPFRHLLRPEHFLFAEKDGKPIGFLLWYPDFNSMVGPGREIGLYHLLRYHISNPLRTVRLAEVALLPEYRRSPAMAVMLQKSLPALERMGYEVCEGGFIFTENRSSIVMTQRYIQRGTGASMEPYRKYGIFEAAL
jgi:hypothetical protein